jgi:hypothetical protein
MRRPLLFNWAMHGIAPTDLNSFKRGLGGAIW